MNILIPDEVTLPAEFSPHDTFRDLHSYIIIITIIIARSWPFLDEETVMYSMVL